MAQAGSALGVDISVPAIERARELPRPRGYATSPSSRPTRRSTIFRGSVSTWRSADSDDVFAEPVAAHQHRTGAAPGWAPGDDGLAGSRSQRVGHGHPAVPDRPEGSAAIASADRIHSRWPIRRPSPGSWRLRVRRRHLHGRPRTHDFGPDVATALDWIRGFACTRETLNRLDPPPPHARSGGCARRSPRTAATKALGSIPAPGSSPLAASPPVIVVGGPADRRLDEVRLSPPSPSTAGIEGSRAGQRPRRRHSADLSDSAPGRKAIHGYLDQMWGQAMAAFQAEARRTAGQAPGPPRRREQISNHRQQEELSAPRQQARRSSSPSGTRLPYRFRPTGIHAVHRGIQQMVARPPHGTAEMAEAVLDPRTGGRYYERGVDGSECEWGQVRPATRRTALWSRGRLPRIQTPGSMTRTSRGPANSR